MKRSRYRTAGILSRISIGLFVLSVAIAAQAVERDAAITVGQRFQIESKVLNETRRYFVHTPYKYRLRNDRHPVLVVLDADTNFAHTSAAVNRLASSGRIPEMIVVGITNTNRQRDLIPPDATDANRQQAVATLATNASAALAASTGAADRFLAFLADELLPHIDRNFRTHSYRVLVGHSLGGAFAVYALQSRPNVFGAYVAMSPSLPVNNESLLKGMEPFLASHASLNADLYLTVGDEPVLEPALNKLTMILTDKAPTGLHWKSVPQLSESHQSIPYRGVHDGLQQIFAGWTLPDPMAMYDRSGLAGIEAHFANLSQRLGFTVPVQGNVAEVLFGQFLRDGRFKEADALIQKAVTWFPESVQVHVAATMLYSMMNDQPRVIEHAKKILARSPGNAEALKILGQDAIDTRQPITEFNVSPKTLKTFAGSYASEDELIDIRMKDDKLYSTSDAGEFELKATSAVSFHLSGTQMKLTFVKDRKGKVSSVALDRLGTALFATETLRPR